MALTKGGSGSSPTTNTLQLTGQNLTSTVNGVSSTADLSGLVITITYSAGVISVNGVPLITGIEQRDSFGNFLGYLLP